MKALAQVLPLVAIVAIFWLVLIRPQRRRALEMAAMQRSAEVGDEVMLTSGIYGTISLVEDDTALLTLHSGAVVKVARGAIAQVVPEAVAGPDADHAAHEPGIDPSL